MCGGEGFGGGGKIDRQTERQTDRPIIADREAGVDKAHSRKPEIRRRHSTLANNTILDQPHRGGGSSSVIWRRGRECWWCGCRERGCGVGRRNESVRQAPAPEGGPGLEGESCIGAHVTRDNTPERDVAGEIEIPYVRGRVLCHDCTVDRRPG